MLQVECMAGGTPAHTTIPENRVERFEIVGRALVMQDLFRDLRSVSQSDATVLIEGETGVGKSLVARGLHTLGSRAHRPLVTLNAANLTDELFENELFGDSHGALAGAYGNHQGLARSSAGGTLFIDEIDKLSLVAQARLLCFLDQQEARPVGGPRAIKAALRLICATNRDLRLAVKRERFRRDLYYRLRVIALRIPSLRERREDVPLLISHFIRRFSEHYGKIVSGLSPNAERMLLEHEWEGNVRELENEIERAVLLTPEGAAIQTDVISVEAQLPAVSQIPVGTSVPCGSLLRESRREAERAVISQTLKRHRWNVSAAARELGISRVGLTRKLKRLGIHRPRARPAAN